jgi:hypothetical protein
MTLPLRLLSLLFLPSFALAQVQGPMPSAQPRPAPMPVPHDDSIPGLKLQSAWAQAVRYEGEQPDLRQRGAYVIGNGSAFGCLGLGARANTITALIGPTYASLGGGGPEQTTFGSVTLALRRGAALLPLEQQQVRRIRGTGLVATEDRQPDGLALRTLAFARRSGADAPAPQILCLIEVVNDGAQAAAACELIAQPDGPVAADGTGLVESLTVGGRQFRARYAFAGGRNGGQQCLVDVPELAPGARHRTALTISFAAGDQVPAPEAAAAEAEQAAQATVAWWQQRLAGSAQVDTDHHRLADLFEDGKVATLCQRDEASGLVVPMLGVRDASIRDNAGVMLTFLRSNLWDDARTILRWWYRAVASLGRVPDRLPLDFAAPVDAKPDWNRLAVPASDVPLWLVMQNFWYWRVTYDHQLIREHWPLVDACVKRLPKHKESLIPFAGDEPVLHGTLLRQFPSGIGDGSMLIAEDGARDRKAWSLASSAMYLLAVQALGEIVDGIDRQVNPDKWAGEGPAVRPSQAYVTRSFGIMRDIEQRFWLDEPGHFAPAISAVSEQPHPVPVANLNLFPLWIGWTFPSGERSRDNLRNSLARLWLKDMRLGTTPTCGLATGDVQAMFVVALAERDATGRLDALDALLAQGQPAGEWADLYDADGRPITGPVGAGPTRARPHLIGINVDAAIYAVNGIRFAVYPNWDNTDIRAELRMPEGASYMTFKDLKKDGRHLHVYMREVRQRLTAEELEENSKKKPEEQRDPEAEHRRLAFRMELVAGSPVRGYYDVGLNAMGTMFVRYLWPDGRVIDEKEFWAKDKEPFVPAEPMLAPRWSSFAPKSGATQLVLAARRAAADLVRDEAVSLIDTGAPMRAEDLAAAIVDADGKPRHPTLLLDYGCDQEGPATLKTRAFWSHGPVADALAKFTAGGGRLLRTAFLARAKDQNGHDRVAADGAAFTVRRGDRLTFTVRAERAAEHVLRSGSSCGIRIRLGGREVVAREQGAIAMPDTDAALVQLTPGSHELVVEALGDGVLFVRLSDPRGFPAEGVALDG